MKLFPPQQPVSIYEDGFGDKDLLGRKPAGQRLSELLEKVDDPLVLAVDGPWGSGKSHFLKRWVGAHGKENGGAATTVYFDAFANDFLDDPFIGLIAAISERLPAGDESRAWKAAKNFAAKLARPAFRIGAAAATKGASELVGPAVDAVLDAGSKEVDKAAEAFWRREEGRKAAKKQFENHLAKLTAPSTAVEEPSKERGTPLIVVVDELDRCRPDFALSVLEVIKHFFAVPHVHFVLGVNMKALEHMVRVRYGSEIDATDYLKRFISVSMRLPDVLPGPDQLRTQIVYFRAMASAMGIDQKVSEIFGQHLLLLSRNSSISLRDIEKILTRIVLLPRRKDLPRTYFGWLTLITSLVIAQAVRPALFEAAVDGRVEIRNVDEFYGISQAQIDRNRDRPEEYDHQAFLVHNMWAYALTGPSGESDGDQHVAREFGTFGVRDYRTILPNIVRDYFGLFEVAD